MADIMSQEEIDDLLNLSLTDDVIDIVDENENICTNEKTLSIFIKTKDDLKVRWKRDDTHIYFIVTHIEKHYYIKIPKQFKKCYGLYDRTRIFNGQLIKFYTECRH